MNFTTDDLYSGLLSFSESLNTNSSINVSLNYTKVIQTGAGQIIQGDSSTIKAVKTAALCVIFLLSIIGNPVLIASVYKNTNRRMHTTSNYFIVNLAVADLLITIIQIPRMIVYVYVGHEWLVGGTFGLITCKLVIFIPFASIFTSTMSFLVIAVDRFFAVFYPMRRQLEGKAAGLVIALTWFIPACFYYILFHFSKLQPFLGKTVCAASDLLTKLFKTMDRYVVYNWTAFTLVIGVPLLVTSALYVAIAIKLWKTKMPGQMTASARARREHTNGKVITMLVVVVLVFFIGYVPSWIAQIVCDTDTTLKFCFLDDYAFFKFFMLYSNSAVRPFVYPIFNQNFRLGFYCIFVGIFRCSYTNNPQQVFPLSNRSDISSTIRSRVTVRSTMPATEV